MKKIILGMLIVFAVQYAWAPLYAQYKHGNTINEMNDCIGGWRQQHGFDYGSLSYTLIRWTCPEGYYVDPFNL